jgi:hypothetical protein
MSFAILERNERVSVYLCVPKQRVAKTAAVFRHHQHNFEFMLGKSEVVGLTGHADRAYAVRRPLGGGVMRSSDLLGRRANDGTQSLRTSA